MRTIVTIALAVLCSGIAGAADSEALRRLLNTRSSGSPREYAAAAEIVARDAAAGHPLQQFVMAVFSKDRAMPASVRLTDEQRRKYLEESKERILALAKKKNNPLAWYLLSLEANDRTMLRRAVDGGNVQALNAWGTILLNEMVSKGGLDTNGVWRIMKRGYECFEKAAAQKDPNGLYNFGMCLLNGYGCERDPEKALSYFMAAALSDHPEAINNIGGFYRDGIVVEKDDFLATRYFSRSAELGNTYGELNFALALQRGEGIAQDEARAFGLFKDAASKGNAEAMNALGMCYFTGSGTEKNELAAVMWFRRSSALGFAPAMENLAVFYERGIGGLEKSISMGTVYKMRARAAQGDRNAAAWLAQNGYSLR